MMDKNQPDKWTQADIDLIKSSFGPGSEEFVYQIRSVLFQFPIEKPPVLSEELIKIMRKLLLPELSADNPLGKQSDFYFSLSSIKDIPPDVAALHIEAFDLAKEYLEDRLIALAGGFCTNISLAGLKSSEKTGIDRFIRMLAYQILANSYIESCLITLQTMAKPPETEEEKAKRLSIDSSK